MQAAMNAIDGSVAELSSVLIVDPVHQQTDRQTGCTQSFNVRVDSDTNTCVQWDYAFNMKLKMRSRGIVCEQELVKPRLRMQWDYALPRNSGSYTSWNAKSDFVSGALLE